MLLAHACYSSASNPPPQPSLLSVMDNHIFAKEMISDNVTNEAFTFSFLRGEQHQASSQHRASSAFDIKRYAITAACAEPHHCQLYEHELFFDMDINLPNIRWGDSPQTPRSLSVHLQQDHNHVGSALENMIRSSHEGQEFEFHIAFSDNGLRHDSFTMEALSPADDLFYKGQLLPLHLPRRLRMVEQLSSLDGTNLADEEDGFGTTATPADSEDSSHITTVAELINREGHPAYPNRGRYIIGGEDKARRANRTMVRATSPCIYVREDEHDSNVFPGCYKDPSDLQMFHGDVRQSRHAAMSTTPRGCARSSTGWKVLLPSSRRLSCQDVGLWEESYHGLDTRRAKEGKKRGSFSMLRFRAPASFFKSFFNNSRGVDAGGLLVQHKDKHRQYIAGGVVSPLSATGVEDDEGDDDAGHLNGGHHATGADLGHGTAGCSAAYMLSKTLTLNSREAHERDKILKKARECLHKLFKSMYVYLSHTHREQSRNLLESTTSSSMDGSMSTCSSVSTSSSSSRCKHGNLNINEGNEPMKSVLQMQKNEALMESLRTASFSKRVRRNSTDHCRSRTHGGAMDTTRFHDEGPRAAIAILRNSSCGGSASCLVHEVENPIQGAIAHCKQSSSLPR